MKRGSEEDFNSINDLPPVIQREQRSRLFDVWAKRWKPENDDFEWHRFTDCAVRWTSHSSRPMLCYKETVFEESAAGWRPVYWIDVIIPSAAVAPGNKIAA